MHIAVRWDDARLTYMAYISEAPLVLPEHEKERYQLMRTLFPSLGERTCPLPPPPGTGHTGWVARAE
jgi:hypothetical protein